MLLRLDRCVEHNEWTDWNGAPAMLAADYDWPDDTDWDAVNLHQPPRPTAADLVTRPYQLPWICLGGWEALTVAPCRQAATPGEPVPATRLEVALGDRHWHVYVTQTPDEVAAIYRTVAPSELAQGVTVLRPGLCPRCGMPHAKGSGSQLQCLMCGSVSPPEAWNRAAIEDTEA